MLSLESSAVLSGSPFWCLLWLVVFCTFFESDFVVLLNAFLFLSLKHTPFYKIISTVFLSLRSDYDFNGPTAALVVCFCKAA